MTSSTPPPVLLWFRKDLRLDDNLALQAAVADDRPVIPVYIREPADAGTGPLGGAQAWWLHHSLAALTKALRAIGSDLILLDGEPGQVIADLAKETGATSVVWNRRYDPAGIAADTRLKRQLRDGNLGVESFSGQLLHEPGRLLNGSGGPYKVYTPFWKAFERGEEPRLPMDAPTEIRPPDVWPGSAALADWRLLPTKPDWAMAFPEVWAPGEAAALDRLADFTEGAIDGYKLNRDFPARPAASMLSPHLAMGEISPYRVWHATRHLPQDVSAEDRTHFRKELVWREFCYHLIFHFPELPDKNWNSKFDSFSWSFDAGAFKRWTHGLTGYPIVDAGMRQLWRHGIMHNRVRMIVASFLIKDLLIDWRHGERWFRDTLVDADSASNAANWQWVAGSGADASPFFRVFNPILQGEKFDGGGTYVREFVPELSGLPDRYIHRPFEAPPEVLARAGIVLGDTYPRPMVDHGKARDRALAAYSALKAP